MGTPISKVNGIVYDEATAVCWMPGRAPKPACADDLPSGAECVDIYRAPSEKAWGKIQDTSQDQHAYLVWNWPSSWDEFMQSGRSTFAYFRGNARELDKIVNSDDTNVPAKVIAGVLGVTNTAPAVGEAVVKISTGVVTESVAIVSGEESLGQFVENAISGITSTAFEVFLSMEQIVNGEPCGGLYSLVESGTRLYAMVEGLRTGIGTFKDVAKNIGENITKRSSTPMLVSNAGTVNTVQNIGVASVNFPTTILMSGIAGETSGQPEPPKRKVGRPQTFSDTEIAEALKRTDGNQTKAAKDLRKISREAIGQRINVAKPDSPLAKFKDVKGKRGWPQKFSDAQIAKALERNKDNRTKAAKDLRKMSVPGINHRIHRAKPDSPLAKFKDVKEKRGGPQKFSDAEIAEALERNNGHQTKAAKKLGMSKQAVNARIKGAKPDSPLAEFKK